MYHKHAISHYATYIGHVHLQAVKNSVSDNESFACMQSHGTRVCVGDQDTMNICGISSRTLHLHAFIPKQLHAPQAYCTTIGHRH